MNISPNSPFFGDASILEAAALVTESSDAKEIEILTFLYTGGKEKQKTDVIKKEVGADARFDSAMKSLERQSFIVSISTGVSITKKGVNHLLKKHPELQEEFVTEDTVSGMKDIKELVKMLRTDDYTVPEAKDEWSKGRPKSTFKAALLGAVNKGYIKVSKDDKITLDSSAKHL